MKNLKMDKKMNSNFMLYNVNLFSIYQNERKKRRNKERGRKKKNEQV